MSNQPNYEIQQTSTPEGQLEHLPTKTHASEQAIQELTEEQLETVDGGIAIGGGAVLGWVPKALNQGGAKLVKAFPSLATKFPKVFY